MGGFIAYSLSSGIIDRTGSVPDGDEMMQAQPGEAVLLNSDPAITGTTHWVDLGPPPTLMTKAPMPTSIDKTYIAANASQSATITGVPQGSSLYVNGIYNRRVDDGTVTFSAVAIGTYALLLTHYRYLDQGYSVDVGLMSLPVAVETEYAVNVRALLPVAIETEVAIVAGMERIVQLPIAAEVETAVVAVMSITANLAAATENEQAVAADLDAATETETANDATLNTTTQLPATVETEAAFDIAA